MGMASEAIGVRYLLLFENILAIFTFLAALLVYAIYYRYLHPLANVPGPFWAALTNIWWARTAATGDAHIRTLKLHEKYGNIVRIAPNDIIICEPNAFKIIYGIGNKYRKSDFYEPLQGDLKWDLTAERDEALHRMERRLVQRAYSMDALKSHEDYVTTSINKWIDRMMGLTGNAINIGHWLQLYAIDTITAITFSTPFDFVTAGADDGTLAKAQEFLSTASWIGYIRWVARLHDFLIPIFGVWLGHGVRRKNFRSLTDQKVKERLAKTDVHGDIFDHLLQVHKKKPNEYSHSDLVSTLTSNVFAGSDTTAIALRSMVWNLLKHPDKLERFMTELEERKSAGLLSMPVRFEEAQKWPYLQAIMFEAIRIHSPFALHLPRVVPESGLLVKNKYFLPKGTCVGTNPWAIHHSKEVFGPDADKFIPERWLDPAKKGDYQRFFFGFGGGSRTCLGRNVVWMEMSMLLPTFLNAFNISLVSPDKPLNVRNV
ncbi:cytochrome P450 family protein [Aspergillus pseudoustus]|uniref:Cytochrome P450 family protein n=1 Tax=Aspergillus pseudoustus TaxID=1810923 RepID=A0ABR4KUK5_9EURO